VSMSSRSVWIWTAGPCFWGVHQFVAGRSRTMYVGAFHPHVPFYQ
jgi:hypothetical protein